MATLTIRNLDDRTHRALRIRAAENGRSVEEEVRRILADVADGVSVSQRPLSPAELKAALKKAQAFFAPMKESYSVDKFIAEKRKEAAREFGERPKKSRR